MRSLSHSHTHARVYIHREFHSCFNMYVIGIETTVQFPYIFHFPTTPVLCPTFVQLLHHFHYYESQTRKILLRGIVHKYVHITFLRITYTHTCEIRPPNSTYKFKIDVGKWNTKRMEVPTNRSKDGFCWIPWNLPERKARFYVAVKSKDSLRLDGLYSGHKRTLNDSFKGGRKKRGREGQQYSSRVGIFLEGSRHLATRTK